VRSKIPEFVRALCMQVYQSTESHNFFLFEALDSGIECWSEHVNRVSQTRWIRSGGSGIPSKSCTGVSYSVQGWSIVSVHTENVSTTKFSNSR
jgi:hypothetical protein